jgi:ATP-dependent helicase Lhr and Lhr-like helicase
MSGADPLNLAGIITPGETVPALPTNRILYRDGIPVAVKEGQGKERFLVYIPSDNEPELRAALLRRRVAPLVRAYAGRAPTSSSARPIIPAARTPNSP